MREGDGELVARLRICLDSVGVGLSCLVSQAMTLLMKRSLLTQLGWALALLGSASADGARSAADVARAAGLDVEVLPSLDLALQRQVDKKNVSGVIAMIGREGKIGYYETFGKRVIEGDAPMTRETLFRIYSMTKPITGMAAMILIDEGKLGLDQPLAEILPKFADMRVQRTYDGSLTDTVPAERPITIRQLLTHTAGLGYNIVQKGPISQAYVQHGIVPGQVSRLPIPGLGRAPAVQGLDTFADRLAEMPLVLQPGSKWSYSVGLDLMGRVIEVASGMPFDRFLDERIFQPTGMTSTWFRVPQSEIGRFTTNYGIVNGVPIPIDPARASIYLDEPSFPFGGAGLVSSPRDYDRFLRMLLGYGAIDGTRVMSEAAVKLGTSNILPETATTEGTWVAGQGYGAGGRVSEGSYGWGGAAGTVAFVNFAADLRAALFTQYMPSEAYPIHEGFPAAVVSDLTAMRAAA